MASQLGRPNMAIGAQLLPNSTQPNPREKSYAGAAHRVAFAGQALVPVKQCPVERVDFQASLGEPNLR